MAPQLISFIVLVLAALLVFASLFRNNGKHKKLKPPQPPSWPIIGNLHLLMEKQPLHRILSTLSERYGPIMHLQLGSRPVLIISSSHLAQECFTVNDRIFASRPRTCAGKHMGYDFKILGWAPYGSYWRNIRKTCTLQLFSAHRIESMKHVRQEEISALIHSLFERCRQQDTAENMKFRLAELTFNIIVRMVAGKRCVAAAYSEDSHEAQHFKKMIAEGFLLAGAFNVGDYLPFLKWLDLQGLEARMRNLHKKRDDFVQKLVDDHRQKPRNGGVQQTEDLIDVLISATESNEIPSDSNDAVVKATALQMVVAGTDTTAVTVEWALAALLLQPQLLKKAQQELDIHIGRDRIVEESDLPNLKYLQAVVKETLRLYPAAPLLAPHESTETCTVGGFRVPAGTRLIVNAWAIHRDPTVWERPTEFDPERFLKGDKEIGVKGQDFEFIPFGTGRRICPGMSLALCVVSYTLARLLQSFEWNVREGSTIDMREGVGLTMPKADPLEAVIQPRLCPHLY